MRPEYLRTGKILGSFGLNGHLKVKIISDFPDRFDTGNRIFININGFYKQHFINESTLLGNGQVRLLLNSVGNVDEARMYAGKDIYVLTQDFECSFKELGDDLYHFTELIGLNVFYKGNSFGSVKDIVDVGGGSTLVVEVDNKEYLIPFVDSMTEVTDAGVVLTPPEGLIESQ